MIRKNFPVLVWFGIWYSVVLGVFGMVWVNFGLVFDVSSDGVIEANNS